jgi:hypothetical protein
MLEQPREGMEGVADPQVQQTEEQRTQWAEVERVEAVVVLAAELAQRHLVLIPVHPSLNLVRPERLDVAAEGVQEVRATSFATAVLVVQVAMAIALFVS